ncbi:MAG TPA: hypothetical protein VGG26_09685 [Terracidiphilus sp.]|jgi:hypothetical protein
MGRALGILLFQAASLFWVEWPSRMAANRALWAAGLVLQSALAFTVFRKGMPRRFPAFTALILFYPVRAALLFALAARMDSGTYNSVFNALALVEIPLQALAAAELTTRLAAQFGGSTRRRVLILLAAAAAVCGLTAIALHMIAERQLTDRIQIFMSFLFIGILTLALLGALRTGSRARNLVCIAAGFAAFAVFQIAALAGKAHAMSRRDGVAYVAWSYLPACGYLAVVIFWLIFLKRESREDGTQQV